ncbi:MAG: PaaX family transcriptional regulator [Micromonosporaceae bacterium]
MQARSALFDLYGDYLRPRGGYAPVAALVRLLSPLAIAAPAVRTAVSRMVRQGWLRPTRLPNGAGYALTPKAVRRVDEAASRIYRIGSPDWDGRFDLVVVELPASRTARSRLASTLSYLGYGQLNPTTWLAPRPAAELDSLLAEADVTAERFAARPTGSAAQPPGIAARPAGVVPEASRLVDRAWDLDELAGAYRGFMADLGPVVEPVAVVDGDEAGYIARFRLVHAWRSFLFRDPRLPAELLPDNWPGDLAASFFDQHARRLRPAADRYVEARLAGDTRLTPALRGVL